MLPKPEKIKKSVNNAEQLDFVDSLSHEKKVANKRRFVSIFLILTVGLSIGFWTYHSIKNFTFKNSLSKINFSLPKLSLDSIQVNQNNLDKEIIDMIPLDTNSWSIYAYSVNPQDKVFTFNLNSSIDDPNTLIQKLSNLPYSSQSILVSTLPQGTKIQEIIDNQSDSYSQESLITIPHQNILFNIKISGSNLDKSKTEIPAIVEKIYWQIMALNQ